MLEDAVSQRAMQANATLLQRVRNEHGDGEHYDVAVPILVQDSTRKWGVVRVGLAANIVETDRFCRKFRF